MNKYDIEYLDYLDDIRDPARAARGMFAAIVFAIVFWPTLCGIVMLANKFIGGG